MMLHAKTDSDGSTSSTPKSATSHNQPLYYVISPPHDFSPPQTSPLFSSPINSPLHPSRPSNSSNTSSRVHSHSSYSSRVSGFGRRYWRSKRGWNECNVIKEEEDCEFIYCDYQRCKCLIAVFGLAALFTLFCLIIWGASRPYHPQVSLKSLTVYNFYSGEGSDFSGVPTKMLTVNCSVEMSITNPATFFGIHVHSTTVSLIFSQITVATGQLQKKYLPRTSQGIVHVDMKGKRVPLYGAGASLPIVSDKPDTVPMKLDMEIISNGNVVGKLVKTKHLQHITCFLLITNSRNIELWKWYQNSLAVHPVKTQVISSGIIWGVGDIAAQSITHSTAKNLSHAHHEDEEFKISWKRVAITSLFGFGFVGPFGHFWYEGMDRFIRTGLKLQPNTARFVATKVAMDGLIFGPLDLLVFLSYMGYSSGKNTLQVKEDLKRDFLPAFILQGAAWPVLQIANFRYVPLRFQLLYVNMFCLVDSAFLSWLEQQQDASWKQFLTSSITSKGQDRR